MELLEFRGFARGKKVSEPIKWKREKLARSRVRHPRRVFDRKGGRNVFVRMAFTKAIMSESLCGSRGLHSFLSAEG